VIEFPPYRLDQRAGRLWRGAQPVELRPKAWALLHYLAERPGALVTKEELHAAVWGDTVVSDDTLTQTLGELRRALGDDPRAPRVIETVHRRGVRFVARVQPVPGDGPLPSPVGSASPPAVDAPGSLVGRDAELTTLQTLFRKAAEGDRQVVFLQGEPGIGKTSIVDAFLRWVRGSFAGALTGYGQCVEQHGEREPYMPVLEALERMCQGPARERLLSALRVVAPTWLAQMPSLRPPGDALPLRREDAHTTPHRMLREFASLIDAVSADQPMVLVLEDLHWSDQGTVDLVSVLAQRPDRARAMLLGTYRPAEATVLDHPLTRVVTTLRTRLRCREIALEYLSRRDVAAYLAHRFGDTAVHGDVAAVVHAHTDGNPLFVVRLVDHLLERGWLTEHGGAWRLSADRATIEQEVPDDIQRLIQGQLRYVSRPEQDVLEVASAAGVTFDAPAVAAGLDRALDEVESLCDELSRPRRWLERRRVLEWPDGTLAVRYAFGHALYRRVLYDRLSSSRRAILHQRIGERLEAGHAPRTSEVAAELAVHFQRSRDRRRALGYLEQAAKRAYDRLAYRDAVACLDTALQLLVELPETADRARDELRLRQLYTAVLSQTAGYVAETLLVNLTRAQALSEQLSDGGGLFDALCALCLLHSNGGNLSEATRIGQQLSPLSERLDPSAVLEASFLRGGVALWSGDLAAAEAFLAQALASSVDPAEADRPYGVNPVVAARSFEALRRWLRGETERAWAVQGEAMALADQLGRPFTIAHAATLDAYLHLLEGQWAEAARVSTRAVALAEEYGFPLWHGTALVSRGLALVEGGEGERGLTEIQEGLEMLERANLRLGAPLWFAFLAEACRRLGRVEEGLAAVSAGLTRCQDTGARLFEPELWRLRGELTLLSAGEKGREGTSREAEECFGKARALARAQGSTMLERRAARRGVASRKTSR
jgi:DNA-binding winged helix-turn-helix (wHTH) protein/tetratricopeptide (TPR) repeat protein